MLRRLQLEWHTMLEDAHVSERGNVDEHHPRKQCPNNSFAITREHMSTHLVLDNVYISNGKGKLTRKRRLIGENGFMSCLELSYTGSFTGVVLTHDEL